MLLRAITGQSDLTVATLFANRARPELEHTVGFIANFVLLRSRIEGCAVLADVVGRVHRTVVGGIAHQEFPVHAAAPRVAVDGEGRLDRVVFQMLGERIDLTRPAGDVQFRWLVPDLGGRFDFELAVMPLPEETLGVKLDYSAGAISEGWADEFLRAYVALVAAAAASPSQPVEAITAGIAGRFR
jgi:non-ribosomal peptide synthetase component F